MDCLLCRLTGSVLVCNLQPQGAITRFHHVSLMKTWAEAQSYSADNRHVLVKQYMSWWDAQTFCRKNHVDLSSIVTYDDRTNIIQQLSSALMLNSNDAWIGLYRGEWAWSDGKKLIYKPLQSLPQWASDCMVMEQSKGTWKNRSCHDRLSFLKFKSEDIARFFDKKIMTEEDENEKK
uniref:C-type lectin domain-containing protein n=1 Tax=Amphiprion percula TaxID=161767 RepID=A0A3P8T1L4_AMPPE